MKQNSFSDLMNGVMEQAGIPASDLGSHEAYTLHFDGQASVHFICRDGNNVDVVSEAGELRNLQAPGPLVELLSLNRFSDSDFPASVTLHRDTGTVLVWSRQRLHMLDVAMLMQVLDAVRRKTIDIQQTINTTSTPVSGTSSATATHLRMLYR